MEITGLKEIFKAQPAGVGTKYPIASSNIGTILTNAFEIVVFIAGALMFFWAVWGIFQYIFAGGEKEALGKARARITWAIVGFLMVIIAYAVSQFAETIFQQPDIPVTVISKPEPPPSPVVQP